MKTLLVVWCFLISNTVPEDLELEDGRRQIGKEILKALRTRLLHNQDSDEANSNEDSKTRHTDDKVNVPRPKSTREKYTTTSKPVKDDRLGNKSRIKFNNNKEDLLKANKYTNVNFVLYNRGIKFQKQDDSINTIAKTKFRFNCILMVASSNKCFGWDMAASNKTEDNNPNSLRNPGSLLPDNDPNVKPIIRKDKRKGSKKNKAGKKKERATRRQLGNLEDMPTYNIFL